jgi:hypothetical protein
VSSPCITSVSPQRPKDSVVEVPAGSSAKARRAVQRAVNAGPTVHLAVSGRGRPVQSGSDRDSSSYSPPEQVKAARDRYPRARPVPVATAS